MVTINANIPGNFGLGPSPDFNSLKDADCMDSRVRTISRGYVKVTEVMPASAPHNNRWYEFKGAPGVLSNH
jgi:hypothetical protein